MNKNELVTALAQKTGLEKKTAETALTAVIDIIGDALKADDKIQLIGFGSFESKQRDAYTARNPGTGNPVEVKACKVFSFKPGKALKDKVNG